MKTKKIKLGYGERDKLFQKKFSELKIKVVLNWFEIFALLAVSFIITLKATAQLNFETLFLPVGISLVAASLVTFLFCCFRKYQLNITRFDKEYIYKKISNDLIDESKQTA